MSIKLLTKISQLTIQEERAKRQGITTVNSMYAAVQTWHDCDTGQYARRFVLPIAQAKRMARVLQGLLHGRVELKRTIATAADSVALLRTDCTLNTDFEIIGEYLAGEIA